MNPAQIVWENIQQRRSVRPPLFTDRIVPHQDVQRMLEAATWAPSHGLTESWRFAVHAGGAKDTLAERIIELFQSVMGPNAPTEPQNKIRGMCHKASHVIALGYQMPEPARFPEFEEIAALGAAVQNLHLMATALGATGFWSSPGFVYAPKAAERIDCPELGKLVGFFYLGYADPEQSIPTPSRSSVDSKTTWKA